MGRPLITLDTIMASMAGYPHLRRLCDCMFRHTIPDIEIASYLNIEATARYREDFGDFSYRILRVQYDGKPMTYVELVVLNYGFWQLASARSMLQEEEMLLLDAAVTPTAMQLIDRSRCIHDVMASC